MKRASKKASAACLILSVLLMISLIQCSGTAKDGSLKDALIWRVTRDGQEKPSYLFGTVHVMDTTLPNIHKTVIEQLKRSDILVFETNLALENYPRKALEQAMMTGDSLEGIMKEGKYETIRSFFLEEFGFPLELVKRMKPFYLASLIGSLQSPRASTSHEQMLMEVARQEDKPIWGLSTLEKESELLDRIPLEEQMHFLFDEIESYRNGNSRLKQQEIMEAYAAADIETIHSSVCESLSTYDSIYACMFSLRNASWLPVMTELMQKESCFFAVGVGHLAGESGLIRLLMKEGYKVVPVHLDFWFHD